MLLTAVLMAGCAPHDSPAVRKYETWLQARWNLPKYAVGTPRASDDIVFITDLRSHPDDGLSKVQLKTSPDRVYYVYANQTNRLITPVFFDALAAVAIPTGRWTYIDSSGRFAYPPLFRYANPFVDGAATAQLAELGTWVLLRKTALGKAGSIKELDPSIASIQTFSAGRAVFTTFDGLSGYLDRKGALVIPASFNSARAFCPDGSAAVRTGKKWGLVDLDGVLIARPEYDDIRCFSEDLAAAKKGAWGFLDKKGNFAIAPRFASVEDFSEGFASFKSNSGAYGFIDRSGSIVVPAKYSWVYPFQFGIAKAGTRHTDWLIYPLSFIVPADPHYTSWTYVDKQGTVVASGGE